ncbi:hypothetical protein [Candidatus Mycoplasma mahonii]|nr:hypothetical protein [Candidatus Mycoplasma mahonii]WKX02283.1 hypothetical protein O3I44_02665 [Candidatus Mycoplasma mahonii]
MINWIRRMTIKYLASEIKRGDKVPESFKIKPSLKLIVETIV